MPVYGTGKSLGRDDMPKRILIVDDSEQTRAIIREIIVPLGYAISEATDGNDAIESVKQGGIDGMIGGGGGCGMRTTE